LKTLFAAITATLLMHAGAAKADRIQLPDDPDITASVGFGVFTGHRSDSLALTRMQPPFIRGELTLFRRPNWHWLNRLNVYGSLSLEFVDLSYREKLKEVTVEDDAGNPYSVLENGVKRADLSADGNVSFGGGLRLSLYDHPTLFSPDIGLHVDAFGEYSGSIRNIPANVDILLVNWEEIELNIASIAKANAKLTFGWSMLHYGVVIGIPIRAWKNEKNLRLTPFAMVGRLHFRASVNIKVDERFQRTLDALGVEADVIPKEKSILLENFSGSAGARLDIGRRNALEAAGSFIATRSGTRVFWATLSYSFRFNYPW